MVEFLDIQSAHLEAVKKAFTLADVTIFTLGLTEAWVSTLDGAVFPTCPGTVGGEFDSERHRFKNFTVDEVVADMARAFALIGRWNPSARFIVTVSPVPLVATATDQHVLSATILSKSILRVAAGELSTDPNVDYFPAYEIVTGPQAPERFFEDNRRDPSTEGIEAVMMALLSACEITDLAPSAAQPPARRRDDATHRLNRDLISAECDEVVLEW